MESGSGIPNHLTCVAPWDIRPTKRNDRRATVFGLVIRQITHPHHIPELLRIGMLSKMCFQEVEHSPIWKTHAEQTISQDFPQEVKWKGDIEALTAQDFVDQLALQKIEGSKDFTASDYKSYFLLEATQSPPHPPIRRIYPETARRLGDGEFIDYHGQSDMEEEGSTLTPSLIEIVPEKPGPLIRFKGVVDVSGTRRTIPYLDEALPFGKRSFWGINRHGWYRFTMPETTELSHEIEHTLIAEECIKWKKLLPEGKSIPMISLDSDSSLFVSAFFEIVGDWCVMYDNGENKRKNWAVQFKLTDPTKYLYVLKPTEGLFIDTVSSLDGGFAVIYKSHQTKNRPPVPIKRLVYWPCGRRSPLLPFDINDHMNETNKVRKVCLTPDRQRLILGYCPTRGDDSTLASIAIRIINLAGGDVPTADGDGKVYRVTPEIRQLINYPAFIHIINESTILYFNRCTRTFIDLAKQKYQFSKICGCTHNLIKEPHDYAITRYSSYALLALSGVTDPEMSLAYIKIPHLPNDWKDISTLESDIRDRCITTIKRLPWQESIRAHFTHYPDNITLRTRYTIEDSETESVSVVIPKPDGARGLGVDQLRAKRMQRLNESRQETITSRTMNLPSQLAASNNPQKALRPTKQQKNN